MIARADRTAEGGGGDGPAAPPRALPPPGGTGAPAHGAGLLGLLQLADSCFPAGGFAFSNGLEGLAKTGRIRGLEDFRQYLACYLGQAAAADLPFLNSAWSAAGAESPPRGGDQGPAAPSDPGDPGDPAAPVDIPPQGTVPGTPETLADILWEWDAFLSLPAPRRASLAMGQAWLRALEGAHAGDSAGEALAALRSRFRDGGLPAHFLMAFAASLRIVGVALGEAQALLLHMALRDQLGAAVRLGLIGSLQAQGLHRRFLAEAETLRLRHADATHHQARKTAPMIEMGQAGHPYLYSRLFQS